MLINLGVNVNSLSIQFEPNIIKKHERLRCKNKDRFIFDSWIAHWQPAFSRGP